MYFKAGDEETICALSTAPGTGGIAVIRVSGDRALEITKKLCRFLPVPAESHRAYFGICRHQSNGEPIDEVVATYFAEGRSFTGEETVEISCHGSQVISAALLKELVQGGARVARRGEFTYRAFMNGKLDLVQAESVLSLIESQNQNAAKVALRQLQGRLSADFGVVENELTWVLAHLEASIDFSTEGLETVSTSVLVDRTSRLAAHIDELLKSYSKGRQIREGLQVALVGRPNVGKSSLLNALLKEDRAIVTAEAGTTRDLVEGQLSFHGVPVTFVDTAGLRETENEVEKIGIARSLRAMESADLVFYIIDATQEGWLDDVVNYVAEKKNQAYFLFNKSDLDQSGELKKAVMKSTENLAIAGRLFWISAVSSDGLAAIENLVGALTKDLGNESSNVVTQARHVELLEKMRTCLQAAVGLMKDDASPEFIAFELQEAIRAIHELLGKEFDEQVIDRIFKEFCLGK
jgi:tRNA modification GTPase